MLHSWNDWVQWLRPWRGAVTPDVFLRYSLLFLVLSLAAPRQKSNEIKGLTRLSPFIIEEITTSSHLFIMKVSFPSEQEYEILCDFYKNPMKYPTTTFPKGGLKHTMTKAANCQIAKSSRLLQNPKKAGPCLVAKPWNSLDVFVLPFLK